MKPHKTSSFDFSLASQSTQPGFEIIEDTKNNVWRFHGNDISGKAILFSHGYSTNESAQRGLKTALNLIKKKKISVQETDKGWQIVVQAANNQELARSLVFQDEDVAKKWLKYFQKVAQSPKPRVGKKPLLETKATSASPKDPVRHAFRLYFYPNGNDGAITGQIENINNPQEKVSFQGVDQVAITTFLQQQLNVGTLAVSDRNDEKSPSPATSIPAVLTPGPSASAVVNKSDDLETSFILAAEHAFPQKSTIESCSIALRHMDSNQVTNLHNVPAKKTTGKQVLIQLGTQGLPTGLYHMNAELWLKTQLQADQSPQCVQGTGWVQLV